MPAKRKLLPNPCPICGRDNGTVQLVYFSSLQEIIIRIGHYTSNRYRKTVRESKKIENNYDKETIDKFDRKKHTNQRAWCSFRLHCSRFPPRLEKKLEKLSNGGYKKSVTIPLPWSVHKIIKQDGWKIQHGWIRHGTTHQTRTIKNIDYFENQSSSQ